MATGLSPVFISGGSNLKLRELCSYKSHSFGKTPRLVVQKKGNQVGTNCNLSVRADNNDGSKGGGSDFVAGFLLGGARFGTLAYVFAPQVISHQYPWL